MVGVEGLERVSSRRVSSIRHTHIYIQDKMAGSDLEQVMAANGLSAGQPGGAGPGSAEQAQAQKEQQEYVYITRYIYACVCVR